MTNDHTAALDTARAFWADIARKNGWYSEPFYVQIWVGHDGTVSDSVAHKNMTKDIVITMTLEPFCAYCAEDHGYDGDGDGEAVRVSNLIEYEGDTAYCYQCESTLDEEWAYMVEIESGVN
jgi:hypothetical protein